MRSTGLIFGVSLAVALGLSGCAGADTSSPVATGETRYEIRSNTVNVFDGSGQLLGEVTGRIQNKSGWARLTTGTSTLSTDFSVRLDQGEWIIEGTAQGTPFRARVSQDGRVLERTAPATLGEDTKALINAVKANPPTDFRTSYHTQDFFSRDNCQAAGYALVGAGTVSADPILLVIGFAFLAGCS